MQCRVSDGDRIYRHAIRPTAFVNSGKVFNHRKLFFFVNKGDDRFEGSSAWGALLPSWHAIHAYGCRLAANRNARKQRSGSPKIKNPQVYCGVYEFTAADVRQLSGTAGLEEIIYANVEHQIEEGEIAHVAVRFAVQPGWEDLEGTKTAIQDRLWWKCRGPARHVCAADQDLPQHPGESLLDSSGGPIVVRDGKFLLAFRNARYFSFLTIYSVLGWCRILIIKHYRSQL